MDANVTHVIVPVAAACIGGALGALTVRAGARGRQERAAATIADLQQQLRAEAERRALVEGEAGRARDLDLELRARMEEITHLTGTLRSVETELDGTRKHFAEQQQAATAMQEQLTNTFQSLSAQALASNNQQFLDLAKNVLNTHQERAKGDLVQRHQAIERLVAPLHESLKGVEQQVGEIEKMRLTAQATLVEQVRALETTASTLATALRAPKARGRWGELQLRRVVELAGMVDRCDFVEQTSTNAEQGRLQPDMVIHLPAGKTVVIDAKTPMDAYMSAMETSDADARLRLFQEHAARVKQHVVDLSRKTYWKQFDSTPEFVVLFLPGEDLFSAALEHEPSLIEYGAEHNVMLATPTSLIAMLRAIAHGWREQALAENARSIRDLGRQLYERTAKIADHWANVGKHLDKAVGSYNEAVSSMESRFLVTARQFATLEVPTDREVRELEPIGLMTRRPSELELVAVAEEIIDVRSNIETVSAAD